MERAGKILSAFPAGLKSLSFETLRQVKGLGANGAATLAAAYELAKLDNSKDYRPVLDSPSRVMEQIPVEVRGGQKEHFIALYLNARNQLIKFETVSIGTLSASLVHPREVFGPGISHSAAALIVAHNHPSGDTHPSPEDKEATKRLQRSGELLGIPLLDHLIVSDHSLFSFREHGLI
jgi:DNA repair protein RadC